MKRILLLCMLVASVSAHAAFTTRIGGNLMSSSGSNFAPSVFMGYSTPGGCMTIGVEYLPVFSPVFISNKIDHQFRVKYDFDIIGLVKCSNVALGPMMVIGISTNEVVSFNVGFSLKYYVYHGLYIYCDELPGMINVQNQTHFQNQFSVGIGFIL